MAVIGAIAYGSFTAPPPSFLGRPTGWASPPDANFIPTSGGAVSPLYGVGLIDSTTDTPFTIQHNQLNTPFALFEESSGTWRDFGGNLASTDTAPYALYSNLSWKTRVGVVKADGDILVIGGEDTASSRNRCATFDPSGNSWTYSTPANYNHPTTLGLDEQALCLGNDGRVYGFGGIDGGGTGGGNIFGYVFRLNTAGTDWEQRAELTSPVADGVGGNTGYHIYRDGFAVPIRNSNLIFHGGGKRAGGLGNYSTFIYDTVANTHSRALILPIPAVPAATDFQKPLVGSLDNGEIYLMGTDDGCIIYDPDTNTLITSTEDPTLAQDPPATTMANGNDSIRMYHGADGRIWLVTRTQGTWVSTHG